MKFGINTLLWTAAFDREHLPLLARIKSWGFDGVEVARFDFAGFRAVEIRRALADHGLGVTGCSALTGDLSFTSDDAAVRTRARDFMKSAIEATAELGAAVLVGPYVSPVGYLSGKRRTDSEWSHAVEELSALGPVLDAHNVSLAVEPLNRFECHTLNTTADARRLCDAVSHARVGILFDTFHANIEEKSLGAAVESLGKHLKHVHTCENDRGIPGSGHVDWAGLFAALGRMNYDQWIVIESFGSRIPEIAAAACIWRDLAPEADLIARDGLKFLRCIARR
jgi:D-psicose/D-tagatose/L-ribulose 3-epimerase